MFYKCYAPTPLDHRRVGLAPRTQFFVGTTLSSTHLHNTYFPTSQLTEGLA